MDLTHQGPTFRASKRRNVFRKRRDHDDDGKASDGDESTQDASAEADTRERESSTAQRQIRTLNTRKLGVAFSSTSTRIVHDDNADNSNALTPANPVEHAQARFVAPTGHIASTDDKHMMAYIDSKLARLTPSTHEATASSPSSSSSTNTTSPQTVGQTTTTALAYQLTHPQSAAHGHLHEVDITQRKPANSAASSISRPTRPPKRPRRDWRNRRNSADRARDAVVEQVLRESQLNIYEPPASTAAHKTSSAAGTTEDNQDADKRMAEEFERNFYAAVEARAIRRAAPPPPASSKKKVEFTRGPKLGGSRAQRAAMHAARLAENAKRLGK